MRILEIEDTSRITAIKKFGKILFGDIRGKNEPDTKHEANVLRLITTFVSRVDQSGDYDSNTPDNKNIIAAFEELEKYKDIFPDVLVPENKTLYRATQISIKEVSKISTSTSYIYKSKAKLQSWTINKFVALDFTSQNQKKTVDEDELSEMIDEVLEASLDDKEFALSNLKKFVGDNRIGVILSFKSKNVKKEPILFKSSFMNLVSQLVFKTDEDEVIRLVNTPLETDIEILANKSLIENFILVNKIFNTSSGVTVKRATGLSAIKKNWKNIFGIENPTEEMKLAAVKQERGWAIQFIENPSEAVQLAAVEQDGNIIKFIKNPSRKTQLIAVKNSPYAIQYINNPSEEVQLMAVKQKEGGFVITYIIKAGIIPSEAVQFAAINPAFHDQFHIDRAYNYIIKGGIKPSEKVKQAAKNNNESINFNLKRLQTLSGITHNES